MSNIFEKFDMKNQAAIVTGGAGLLGKQFCKTLAEAGASVAVADLSLDKAEEVAQGLRNSGYQAISIQVDVTDKQSVEAMVSRTVKEFGELCVLVNSAAMDPKFDSEHSGSGLKRQSGNLPVWEANIILSLHPLEVSAAENYHPILILI